MHVKNIAILTSKESWITPYAKNFVKLLNSKNYLSKLFFDYSEIPLKYKIVFVISYFKIIKKEELKKHRHNLVVHESNLPEGKGWSPLFWQILEGKNKIPIVLFEAVEKVDAGKIYIKDFMVLKGTELHNEIRKTQAKKTFSLCLKFLKQYKNLKPKEQSGNETFYTKRTPTDSKLDINKSIKEQFNLMQIANNEKFPLFFNYKNQKYILKIFKEEQT